MIIGIDLGTTFSVVATIGVDGRPFAITNRLGEQTTPSVVYFESATSVLVGSAARGAGTVDPENTVELIKRQMGNDIQLLFHGVAHTPESVSALILRSLVDDATAHLGASGQVRAVITVPAYFGIREREATLQAANLAGIEVLELLAEPVAAALHYGTSASDVDSAATLVYDLGGGTFDTTVLTVDQEGVRVVATDGDSQLGGADWDDRITSFLLESFARSADGVDPYEDDALVRRIGLQAEEAKRSLSTAMARTVTLRSGTESAAIVLDRSTVDTLGADLVDRTLDIVDRAIAAARTRGVSRIGKVILVGGSTRMPAIAPAIAGRTGIAPKLIDPDLAVVYGAAIRAHQLADESSRTSLSRGGGMLAAIADKPTSSVVPRSFGVLIEDSTDPAGERRIVVHTVHQNEPLPARATTSFCTIVSGQQRVRIQVYEQAGDVPSETVEHNRRVLDGELTGLPALAAGSRIEVTLRVSADGLLQVTAREPASGTTLDLEAYVDGVVDTARAGQLAHAMTGLTVRQ